MIPPWAGVSCSWRPGIWPPSTPTPTWTAPQAGSTTAWPGALGLEETVVLHPSGVDEAGRPWGLLRAGRREPVPLETFLEQVKKGLGCPGLRYVSGGRPVCRVAVGGGACGDGIRAVFDAGCDTFVTADVKYNQFWDARDLGLNLIDAGHFWTEHPVCAALADRLRRQFPQIQVKVSEHHTDCIKFC